MTFQQEIFEISHDGTHFVAEKVTRCETGNNVVMNSATFYDQGKKTWLVSGQEGVCQLYNIQTKIMNCKKYDILVQNENGKIYVENEDDKRREAEEKLRRKISGENREVLSESKIQNIQGKVLSDDYDGELRHRRKSNVIIGENGQVLNANLLGKKNKIESKDQLPNKSDNKSKTLKKKLRLIAHPVNKVQTDFG